MIKQNILIFKINDLEGSLSFFIGFQYKFHVPMYVIYGAKQFQPEYYFKNKIEKIVWLRSSHSRFLHL